MELSIFTPLLEIAYLILIVAAVLLASLGFVKANFVFWQAPFYFPLLGVLSLTIAIGLRVLGVGYMSILFFSFLPILTGLMFRYGFRGKYQLPVYFLAPSFVGLTLLFLYPLYYELHLSFTDLSLGTMSEWIKTGEIPFAGLDNFIDVFKVRASGYSFFSVLSKTILWTGINVFFHVTCGVILALVLNQTWLRSVVLYRTVLILPWVIPQIILVLVWRTEFNESVGLINQFIHVVNQLFSFEWNGAIVAPLTWIGFTPKEWFTDPWALFIAACVVNVWLGIPFMMVNALGALQSISKSYYEAASIDGASPLQSFMHITLPLLKPVMVPVTLLGTIWTFNNLSVIYLMTDGGRYEGADILVTDLYKQSFTFYRYGFAAAYSFVIFIVLCGLIYVQSKISNKLAMTTPKTTEN